jgi:hypothetical protein
MSVVVNGVSDHMSNRVDPPTVDDIHVVVNGVSDHASYRAFDCVLHQFATDCEQNCACERFLFAASAVHLLQRSVMESLVRTNVTRAACLVYHPVPLQLSLHSFKRHSQPPSCLQTHPIRCNILGPVSESVLAKPKSHSTNPQVLGMHKLMLLFP